jgi:hypothetical protein
MNPKTSRIVLSLAAAALLFLFAGCQTLTFDFTSSVDPAYKGASIEVDLIGINTSEIAVWNAKSIDDYFTSGDPFRASVPKKTFYFGEGQPEIARLPSSDPIWREWEAKGATHILVLADLPGYTIPMGGVDLRRQLVPRSSSDWKGTPKAIAIRLGPTGVVLVPSPKPPK